MGALAAFIASLTPGRAALLALAASVATIAGAWVFQWAGYAPCDLCLKQRFAYYAGIPLAALLWLASGTRMRRVLAAGFGVLALAFAANAVLGGWHAGVEWGFWPGPNDCTGALTSAPSVEDFMRQLQTVKVVRCDEVAIRILGLSLAGWNALISAGIATVALFGARSAAGKA